MREIVDKLLAGETVDIGKDSKYYLSLKKEKDFDGYKIGFVKPDSIDRLGFYYVTTKNIKEAGNKLIALADEMESRKRFKEGDILCFIRPDGEIRKIIFFPNDAYHCGLLMSGNAFKTEAEAEAHKDDVLAKFQDLRDQGLV